jgi:hypothetical protein
MDKLDLILIIICQVGLIIFAIGSFMSERKIYKRLERLESDKD